VPVVHHGKKPAVLSVMTHLAVLSPVVTNARFNYFDIVAIVWLIIGLLWGRMRGMSQELLPTLQWIGIVIAGGLLYRCFSPNIHRDTYYSVLWSNIAAYLLLAVAVHLICLRLKQLFDAKLRESKLFGRAEFFLGMMAGTVRFGCMFLVGLALMNAHVATAAELAKAKKSPRHTLARFLFLTYSEFQQDVLFKSISCNWVQANLNSVMIASATSGASPQQGTLADKTNKLIGGAFSREAKR
jgi:uncharacterized membrane protein required for colicin V production